MNFNMMCCVASLTVAFLSTMGVLIYNDVFNDYQPYVPKVHETTVAPMMILSGNWTCFTNMEVYQHIAKRSELKENSQWWSDCNPKSNCQTMMTWLETEINEVGQLVQSRHIEYNHKKLLQEMCMETRGTNSQPYYYNMTDMCAEEKDMTYEMIPGHCVSRFTFRNMLNGDYLIESTYNWNLMERWMGMVGKVYNVKYLEPCMINLQSEAVPALFDHRMHCVLDIKPIDAVTSYDLKDRYETVSLVGKTTPY